MLTVAPPWRGGKSGHYRAKLPRIVGVEETQGKCHRNQTYPALAGKG